MQNENSDFQWTPDMMLEVQLSDPESFLKIRETLTRIGISSKKDNTIYQTCHILHKKGKYYIVSFLELFALDGKDTTLTFEDIGRRNTIASLIEQWGLCTVVADFSFENNRAPMSGIKIVPHSEKSKWNLVPKYTIGKFARR